jgi:MacB-like protein
VAIRAIDGGYFEAMGTRVPRGRGIDRSDIDREAPVVVVNQALANMAFSGHDPIGQRVRFGNPALSRGSPEMADDCRRGGEHADFRARRGKSA